MMNINSVLSIGRVRALKRKTFFKSKERVSDTNSIQEGKELEQGLSCISSVAFVLQEIDQNVEKDQAAVVHEEVGCILANLEKYRRDLLLGLMSYENLQKNFLSIQELKKSVLNSDICTIICEIEVLIAVEIAKASLWFD